MNKLEVSAIPNRKWDPLKQNESKSKIEIKPQSSQSY